MNKTLNQEDNSRVKENSVEILFKGLKRKVSHNSYSKIKNSYKKKPILQLNSDYEHSSIIGAHNPFNKSRLKLSVITNRVVDPEKAHD